MLASTGRCSTRVEVYFAESLREAAGEPARGAAHALLRRAPGLGEVQGQGGGRASPRSRPARRRLIGLGARRGRRATTTPNARTAGRPPSPCEAQYALAQRLVFTQLKAASASTARDLLVTSAAPIRKDVLDFFASLDMVLREVYGQSEVTGPTSVNTADAPPAWARWAGPMPGVEVRIAEDGEILRARRQRVPGLLQGARGHRRAARRTAGCTPATWARSTPTASCTSPAARRRSSSPPAARRRRPPTSRGCSRPFAPLGNALVIGERRNYLVALLALDPEKVPEAFAQRAGLAGGPGRSSPRTPAFRQYLHAGASSAT